MNEENKSEILRMSADSRRKNKIIIICVFAASLAILLICSLIPGLLREDNGGKTQREDYTVDPSKLADTKEEDFDILEYEEYLKLDRSVQYCYTPGVRIGVNDNTLSKYDASFAVVYKLIGTLISGDSEAYNSLVHESVGHFDSFTQQQIYDIVITKHSETTKQGGSGEMYSEHVYVVEYKIHENNGSYRKDIESDACRAQYFVINNSTGKLLVMDMFAKAHAN